MPWIVPNMVDVQLCNFLTFWKDFYKKRKVINFVEMTWQQVHGLLRISLSKELSEPFPKRYRNLTHQWERDNFQSPQPQNRSLYPRLQKVPGSYGLLWNKCTWKKFQPVFQFFSFWTTNLKYTAIAAQYPAGFHNNYCVPVLFIYFRIEFKLITCSRQQGAAQPLFHGNI